MASSPRRGRPLQHASAEVEARFVRQLARAKAREDDLAARLAAARRDKLAVVRAAIDAGMTHESVGVPLGVGRGRVGQMLKDAEKRDA